MTDDASMTEKPCPFCGLSLVYGHDEQGFYVAHIDPQCEAFAARTRELHPDESGPVVIDVDGGRVYPIGTQGPPS